MKKDYLKAEKPFLTWKVIPLLHFDGDRLVLVLVEVSLVDLFNF